MKISTLCSALVALALGLNCGASLAWNKAGHMTSAAIAHDDLKDSDQALIDKSW